MTLQGRGLSIELDPSNGAIQAIRGDGITLTAPAGAAESFRLTLQKPDKSDVTILGRDQPLTNSESHKNLIGLVWNGPLKDTAGSQHDLNVRMDIAIESGELRFTLHVENHSQCKVLAAQYPMLGGLKSFPGADAILWVPTSHSWWRPMRESANPETFPYPGGACMPFCVIQSATEGKSLYLASHDAVARYKQFHFEELPDASGAKNLFGWVQHFPFTPPGKSFDGPPVVLRFVKGNWRDCGAVYRQWFDKTFGICPPEKCWLRRESFFLFTMFMLPEGTINFRFKDIPKWAKAAKAAGLNSVQVSGWQQGGHDNGYPDYTPDARLGTWKDLEDGIRACHKLGMKVYFFVNYQPVMIDSDWYKRELSKYREMGPNGEMTWNAGWGMGTLWARMDHPKKMTWADCAFPEFRKIIVDQFEQLAKIGADGVHVDKMFPTAIEYNPDVPMSPDTAGWEGAITLTKEVMAACRKHNPDWVMSFECNWDRMLQFTGATWWVGNQDITRQVFPENAQTLGLYQACDTLGVNNAVRNGHIVMVAPLNFCRNVDWAPFRPLARYIKEVKRIRDSLQETVFLGEAREHEDVKLAGLPESGIEYGVFRNRQTRLYVCVATNSHMSPGQLTLDSFYGKSGGAVRLYMPFAKPRDVALPATIEVPAERIVFIEELAESTAAALPQAAKDVAQAPLNGDFEAGDFSGWVADPTWVIADDSRQYYAGWQGRYWAWSGGKGEAATGILKSKPFTLDKDGVRLLISGWNSIEGSGKPRRWNFVALKLENGTELDRVYAPNTTNFVTAYLDGSGHKGQRVYIEAVDDADEATYSMLCIDDVRTADLPASYTGPAPSIPDSDPTKVIRLENATHLLEFSRSNGSLTRVRDKHAGLDLILEPRLSGSYRFALQIPGKEWWQTVEANWIVGREQKLTSFELGKSTPDTRHPTPDTPNLLRLTWNGPLRSYLGDKYDASVIETVELTERGALFNLTIENRTACPVGEVYFPLVGGVQGLGTTRKQLKTTELVRPGNTDADIFRSFGNMSWLGDQGPEQFFQVPGSQPDPWVALRSPKADCSVLFGARDIAGRTPVIRLELIPAGSGTMREDGNWPRPGEMGNVPVGVELSFVDISNGPAHGTYHSMPVFLEFLQGEADFQKEYSGWHRGR